MKRRSKILATVGPSSNDVQSLEKMIRAGVNVFRLNFSHGTHEEHEQVLKNIRTAMANCGWIVGVLQDICGPKVRVGELEAPFHLKTGDRLVFMREVTKGYQESEDRYILSINQPSILDLLKVDEYIYLYDGRIRVRVNEISENAVMGIVENNGVLGSNKGVNFPNTRININVITEKDKADMLWGIKNQVDFMAISFVQNADDMRQARQILDENGGTQDLIAKIEKFDAVENIDEILEESDGIMVARGDLGIEVPYYMVPTIQKTLIKKANAQAKPVITATQMLLSMTENEIATRAEISDVANAVLDGTDAVMLSEESAIGHNPTLAVQTMSNTIMQAETIYAYNKFDEFINRDTNDVIDLSITQLATKLGSNGILALTTSGMSIKKMARYRPNVTILAITHSDKIARKLTLVWGVAPAFSVRKNKTELMLSEVMHKGLERGVIKKENTYILTAGDPVGVVGTTNNIRILKENEIEYFASLSEKKKKKEEPVATLF
ncbi:MAG: pyruvate kinase [Campylobacterales bacterium]|nr:pyruvate kinase [Campylobacterales bacterium]